MGLTMQAVFEILSMVKPEETSMCMLGKQDLVSFRWATFKEVLVESGYYYNDKMLKTIVGRSKVDSFDLFNMLGFKEVHAIDVSDAEGADIIFNLAKKSIPEEIKNRFDLIVDGGTLEHVFSITDAMKNTSDMLKMGGGSIPY